MTSIENIRDLYKDSRQSNNSIMKGLNQRKTKSLTLRKKTPDAFKYKDINENELKIKQGSHFIKISDKTIDSSKKYQELKLLNQNYGIKSDDQMYSLNKSKRWEISKKLKNIQEEENDLDIRILKTDLFRKKNKTIEKSNSNITVTSNESKIEPNENFQYEISYASRLSFIKYGNNNKKEKTFRKKTTKKSLNLNELLEEIYYDDHNDTDQELQT
jgi:hypothetical protein